MSQYFSNFPIISYDGVNVRDITRRTNFISANLSNPYLFLPYTVKEGEKPQDIAHNYYGTVDATWIVLMANNILDPYSGWPLDESTFASFIMSKYAEQSGLTGYDVIAWTQSEQSTDNIMYYYTTTGTNSILKASVDSFTDENGDIVLPLGWKPYRIYDYERDTNNNKREILIVENTYYEQINREFKKLIA